MGEIEQKETLYGAFRVLDLTTERGFLCGKILGNFGADVIKIEPPGGDPVRRVRPFYKDTIDPDKSLFWFGFNDSKRSITLNIETAQGKKLLKSLAKTADFVIESYEPGYMESLGLGYSILEQVNPRVIMTSLTPFGQTGPWAHYSASDMTLWALGGFMHSVGEPPPGPPYRVSVPQAYLMGNLHAAGATAVAHYYRETTGEGQHLDVSLCESTLFQSTNLFEFWDLNRVNIQRGGVGWVRPRPNPPGPMTVRWNYACKDGYVNVLVGGGSQAGLVKSMTELIKMADAEGMAGHLKGYDWSKFDASRITQEEIDKIEKIIMDFFRTKTKKELYQAAVEKSMILVPINSMKDISEDLQLATRDYFVRVYHPELGEALTYPGAPVKMSAASWTISRRAPLIGEHNSEIYEKELGFSNEQLAAWKKAGVI